MRYDPPDGWIASVDRVAQCVQVSDEPGGYPGDWQDWRDWHTNCDSGYFPGYPVWRPKTQQELYECELSGRSLDWYDRANSDSSTTGFLRRYYRALDRIHEMATRASPVLGCLSAATRSQSASPDVTWTLTSCAPCHTSRESLLSATGPLVAFAWLPFDSPGFRG